MFVLMSKIQTREILIYACKKTDVIDREGLEMIIDFIKNIICDHDDNLFDWLMTWIAVLVTCPKFKNTTSVIMQSDQGCGKSKFCDFLALLLGRWTILETNSIEPVTQKHNVELASKRLVIINEMSVIKEQFMSSFDKLKNIVSEEHLSIEPKGGERFTVKNLLNLIFCTNHKGSFVLERSDRRYCVLEVSDERCQDIDYFGRLEKRCFNKQTIDSFYMHLLSLNVKKPLYYVPVTVLKTQMQELSKPNAIRFLEEELQREKPHVDYVKYQVWCRDSGEERNMVSKFKFKGFLDNDVRYKALEQRKRETCKDLPMTFLNEFIPRISEDYYCIKPSELYEAFKKWNTTIQHLTQNEFGSSIKDDIRIKRNSKGDYVFQKSKMDRQKQTEMELDGREIIFQPPQPQQEKSEEQKEIENEVRPLAAFKGIVQQLEKEQQSPTATTATPKNTYNEDGTPVGAVYEASMKGSLCKRRNLQQTVDLNQGWNIPEKKKPKTSEQD